MRLDKPEATARKRAGQTSGQGAPAHLPGQEAPGQVSGRAATEAAAVRYPFRFTGSGGEYFRIWLVNVLLSIVTLYVYSAWAKVRTNRYFHGNTVLDGSSFEYHARPLQILLGRIVAVLLFVAATFGSAISPLVSVGATLVLFLVLPWAVWRSTMFNARMTSYRNVRFGFTGGVGGMYLYTLVLPFLPLVLAIGLAMLLGVASEGKEWAIGLLVAAGVIGFYLLSPWVHRGLAGYFAGHHRYGRADFDTTLSTGRFYAIYALSLLLGVALLALLVAIAAAAAYAGGLLGGETLDAWRERLDESGTVKWRGGPIGIVIGAAVYAFLLSVGYLVSAFFRARIRNHLYAGTRVDGRVQLESTVRTWPLWWVMVTNLVLLVATLGLAYPWTKVRLARFFARHTAVRAPGGLHAITDEERERQSAFGEELGDAFDMDMDVGF